MRIRRQVRRAVEPLVRARHLRREGARSGRPVVVLTPGKAASTAIEATIAAYLPDRPAYKVHWLSDAEVTRSAAGYPVAPAHILASLHLRRHLPTPAAPWDVVVPIREPVARNVAAYFQTAGRLDHQIEDPARAATDMVAWGQWRALHTWFDTEVRDTIGVDVFAHPFDPATGTLVVETPPVRLLVLRHEDIAGAPAALSSFLGVEIDALVRANVGSDKAYATAYERFAATAAIPAAALDDVYATRFARHFYDPDEIAAFRARWS